MPIAQLNGIRLSYEVKGTGPLVVLVMGTGSPGRVWHANQVQPLVAAGFQVATLDNRGIAPSDECLDGFTIDDMVADIAALIEHLGGPAHVVGTSMGARITQELALARPDLVSKAVMLATYGRPSVFQERLAEGERALHDANITLPAQYQAAITAILNLSPATLEDPTEGPNWLDIFEFSVASPSAGVRAQMQMDRGGNRVSAYRGIRVPCMVVGFADDRKTPTYLGKEVAQAIPGARYEEIAGCGHYGYLERPEEVNALLLDFLSKG